MVQEYAIVNWSKYNPRKDVKNPSWVRLNHDLFEQPELFHFTHSEKLFWIYVLCMASKRNDGHVLINNEHVQKIGGFAQRDANSALDKLLNLHIMRKVRDVHVTRPIRERNVRDTPTAATNERTNVTNVTNDIAQTAFDATELEEIYKSYPRKLGKKRGMEKITRHLRRKPDDLQNFKTAVDNYAAYVATQGIEPRFVKHFTTFVGEWTDWVEGVPDETPKSGIQKWLEKQGQPTCSK